MPRGSAKISGRSALLLWSVGAGVWRCGAF